MFCCTFVYVHSSFVIILKGKRELVPLLILSAWCLVMVVWLFLAVLWVCLRFVIVVLPDHIYLLFLESPLYQINKTTLAALGHTSTCIISTSISKHSTRAVHTTVSYL